MMTSKPSISFILVALLAATVMFGACSSSGSDDDETVDQEIWNYRIGSLGPSSWASLSPEFAACGSGDAQSPIDIPVDPADDVPQFRFDYRPEELDLENDGNALIFHAASGADVSLGGVKYDLEYVHFHVPGEHHLKGASFDGEIHFYHKSADGRRVVVAVWMTSGLLQKTLSTIILNAPLVRGERIVDSFVTLNPGTLLPEDKTYYRYTGSLSEPPCTEPVEWIVLRTPIEVSTSQLNALNDLVGDNNRPIQPLNERPIRQN